jgi:GT2 family glycosyltransferase
MARTVSARPRISVIVPTYNRAGLLLRTLETLAAQPLDRDAFEVIVSDDGSTDGSAAVADSFIPRLRLRYHFQEDLGYRAATARNAGAMLACAPCLAFLDTGTLAGPHYLSGHLAAHEAGEPQVVLGYTYGYRPLDPTPGLAEAIATDSPLAVFERFRDAPSFRDMRHESLDEVGFDLGQLALPWMFFWAMNFSVTSQAFWEAGGFDEEFREWGAEDVELGFRLVRRGVPIRMNREAWAIEPAHERDIAANTASVKRNMLRFLEKSPEPVNELTWALIEQEAVFAVEDEYKALLRWAAESRSLDVKDEIERAITLRPPGETVSRVCVIGCGADIPDCVPPGAVLVDFDERLLRTALADGRHVGRHAVGLHLTLPDQSADLVVITSRMTGLWPRWGTMVLGEARRVGREAALAWNVGGAR